VYLRERERDGERDRDREDNGSSKYNCKLFENKIVLPFYISSCLPELVLHSKDVINNVALLTTNDFKFKSRIYFYNLLLSISKPSVPRN